MSRDPEHTWGHTLAFGAAYYQRATQLLRAIYQDAGIMAAAAARSASTQRAAAAARMPASWWMARNNWVARW